ncbi:hypothetical protein HYH03_001432 [Edaphochlamys debaryana]|uniref:1,3-beta-glucan synthase n=1 Tax=Edaphochlamys debaryana TaxID=47281 RepID=A0A836C4Y5_9CHLO|nr:hypothetical protein HYH03_001432 [Edaphochlamys debaryana]|eukprot:KAG2500666.1 hypothetical protein HYH03_001432 [Edaphochlamys debaryana]
MASQYNQNPPPPQPGGGGPQQQQPQGVWGDLQLMLGPDDNVQTHPATQQPAYNQYGQPAQQQASFAFQQQPQQAYADPYAQQQQYAPYQQQAYQPYQQQAYQEPAYQQPAYQQPYQDQEAWDAGQKAGFQGNKYKDDEVLRLGPDDPSAPQPGANNWKQFVAGWLADEEEEPTAVDGPNGRVTFGVNPGLAELSGGEGAAPHAAKSPEPGEPPTPSGKSALKKPMRGVSAKPKARGKSAMRRPGAVSAHPDKKEEEEGDGNLEDKGIVKKKKKKKERDRKNPFVMPALHTFAFEHLVHNIVWRVGRNFGFQAFNVNPATRNRGHHAEWTPASIFVASDHLVQMLVKNYFLRRDKGEDERQEERFAKAVFELHTTIFYSYEEHWTHMHGLSIRPQCMQDVLDKSRYCDETVVCGMLTELALYFLVYTESSSMRHCPELLWFLFWCLNHSYVMQDLWNRDPPENFPNIREVRIGLRNKYQALIRELQHVLGIYPDRIRPEDCGRLGPIMSRLKGSDVPEDQRIIIADLIAFGDGNFYYERVVTPIFYVISYEVDHLSNLGVEVSFRLGYDDINESMAHTGIVRLALRDLRVRGEQIINGDVNDAYNTITRLGYKKGSAETTFDPQVAADWWRTNVFVKTFRERRTWLAIYRAYYRVVAIHLVLYHAMQAQAFVGWNWRYISSCLVTHAFCSAFERFSNWYMTRHPPEPTATTLSKVFDKKGHFKISRRANAQALAQARAQGFGESKAIGTDKSRMNPVRVVELEGSPFLGVLGLMEWILFAFFVLGWYVIQFYAGPFQKFCYDFWPLFSYCYVGAYALHFLLTTRDGYCISLTHALNLPNFLKASSSRPDPVNWIYGTMRMKYKLFFMNALFWIIAFAMKIPFDYFIICAPSVAPLTLTFNVDWLECAVDSPYYWGVIPCIGGDWVLAVVRLAPFILIILLDTSLFYQVATTLFGLIRGLFKLDLGVLTDWDQVVKEFYKAPYRWWFKCMSEAGNRNQLTLLKMMLFDNAADPETGAIVSDGRMFKKAVLTPEEIMGTKKRSVNVAAVLDGDDDDDSAAAGGGQGPRGGKGGQGGRGGAGGGGGGGGGDKKGDAKPLSTGWKTALQNFGGGGGQDKKAAKGGPLMPTSNNVKAMQKQLNQMQRLPAKLPMTTITERMMANTERPREAEQAKLASVAEKLLGNKNVQKTAAQLKEMSPEEKRKEIIQRIQAAQKQRKEGGVGGDAGPSAGLPSGDMLSGEGGGPAGLLVNAAPASSPAGRWGRAFGAIKAKRTSNDGGPRRDTLTAAPAADVPAATPDATEALRPFSAGLTGDSRKSLGPTAAAGRPARPQAAGRNGPSGGGAEPGVKADAALPMEELDDDKPASAGSAATPSTLERAGVLNPNAGKDGSRVSTPTIFPAGRIGSTAGAAPGGDAAAGDGANGSGKRDWAANKAAMASDPMVARRESLQSATPPPQLGSPAMQRLASNVGSSPSNSRMSASGLGPSPSMQAAASADAPPRYSWTGTSADAEALGRQMSNNRLAQEAARNNMGSSAMGSTLGRLGSMPRPSRMKKTESANGTDPNSTDGGEYKPQNLSAVQEDDDEDLGGYQGYNPVFGGGAAAEEQLPTPQRLPSPMKPQAAAGGSAPEQPAGRGLSLSPAEAHETVDDFLNELEAKEGSPVGGSAAGGRFSTTGSNSGGKKPGSGGSGPRPGPVAEGVERLTSLTRGIEGVATNWAHLALSGVGPAALSAKSGVLFRPEEVEDDSEEEGGEGEVSDPEGERATTWWSRRVQRAESRAAGEDGADADGGAALTTLTAFRADGDPLAVVYEWRAGEDTAPFSASEGEEAEEEDGRASPRAAARAVAESRESVPPINNVTPRAGAMLRAELTLQDHSRDSSVGTAPVPTAWAAVVAAARASGPVAEAISFVDPSGPPGGDGDDLPNRKRAQAAGIDPSLARGLQRKQEDGGAAGDGGVVRSISGTSLHSNYFKDAKEDDLDPTSAANSHTAKKRGVRIVADDDEPMATGGSATKAGSGHSSKKRGVAFGGEEVEEFDSSKPAIAVGGRPGFAGIGGGSNKVHPSPDEEAAISAAKEIGDGPGGASARSHGSGGGIPMRPKSSYKVSHNRPSEEGEEDLVGGHRSGRHGSGLDPGGNASMARPTTAGRGRNIAQLPRSTQTRSRPMSSALKPDGTPGSMRPMTALRPTTARPTTARPLTALLGGAYDPTKEAREQRRREKKEREAAINRAAEGMGQDIIIIDGADPDEDEEIDEVHAQMMMWNSFAFAWDEIIDDLRMADYINDKEVSMLKFVRLDMGSRGHGLRPILLPTFFYAGQVRKVVDTGQVSTAQVMVLNELRVLVVWLGCQVGLLSGKHAHVITSAPFHRGNINVKHALLRKKMLQHGLKMVDQLEQICERHEVPFDMKDIAENLYQLWVALEGECFAIHKAAERGRATPEDVELASILFEVVADMKNVISSDPEGLKAVMKAALLNNATADYKELLRVIRVIKRMLVTTEAEATPQSEEAQRILGFFINSLGHPSLDKPPSIDKMWSWSILTPLYEEDVLYALDCKQLCKDLGLKMRKMTDLLSETDDSISLMSYLKAMFPYEWSNFRERMAAMVPGVKATDLSEHDFAPGCDMHEFKLELQMWASLRGQLLARTVHGMMLNEVSLRVLAKLEHPMPPNMNELEYKRYIDQLVNPKFEYVVTPQTYGKNRVSKDLRMRWLASSIDILMAKYPRLKVAFLDHAEMDKGPTGFSVMARGRDLNDPAQLAALQAMGIQEDDNGVIEVYRVRLPHNKYSGRGVVLGEGKPENQNHAVIFAFGEGLQAIDMNQDNVLAETLKCRNLVTELLPSTKGAFHLFADDDDEVQITKKTIASEMLYVMRMRQVACTYTAIVGFREWIFSDKSGALGRFAAATEYAFGTITQRTLTHPARIRLHYGHPDMFNKMFVMTRGGMSKATRQLHLTEDVFCGCNHTLRGGRIRYKEYISCGKGRDMGFDSINGFNFKIAGGGGEWAISRESARLGSRLDVFRLLMFYHSCIGFYINSWLTAQAAFWNIYALLVFNMAHASQMSDMLQRIYNVQQILQLGTLSMIPYIGQLILEMGIVKAIVTVFQQIMTGSLFFYMFQQQTVASSFYADMTYGSAKYVGTGRGFNITALDFVKIFTLYTRSHLYYAFELLFMLCSLYAVRGCEVCNYGALTWSGWLLAFVLIFSPLWFNPFSFDIAKVQVNYLAWQRWMHGDVDVMTGTNWYTWNAGQLEKARNDSGNNTDQFMNLVSTIVSCLPYILLCICAASRLDIYMPAAAAYSSVFRSQIVVFLIATVSIWIFVYMTIQVKTYFTELADHKPYRIYRYIMTTCMIVFLILWLALVSRWYEGNGFTTLCVILWANFQLLVAFHRFVTVAYSQNNAMRAFVDSFHYTVDQIIGYTLFVLIAMLSFLGVFSVLQMKILFNDAFAQTAGHARIARAMKDNKVGFDMRTPGRQAGKPGGPPPPPRPAPPPPAGGPGPGGADTKGAAPGPGGAPSVAPTNTTGNPAFDAKSLVTSEHRYL